MERDEFTLKDFNILLLTNKTFKRAYDSLSCEFYPKELEMAIRKRLYEIILNNDEKK